MKAFSSVVLALLLLAPSTHAMKTDSWPTRECQGAFAPIQVGVQLIIVTFAGAAARLALRHTSRGLYKLVETLWASGVDDSLEEQTNLPVRWPSGFRPNYVRHNGLLYLFVDKQGTLAVLNSREGFRTVAILSIGGLQEPGLHIGTEVPSTFTEFARQRRAAWSREPLQWMRGLTVQDDCVIVSLTDEGLLAFVGPSGEAFRTINLDHKGLPIALGDSFYVCGSTSQVLWRISKESLSAKAIALKGPPVVCLAHNQCIYVAQGGSEPRLSIYDPAAGRCRKSMRLQLTPSRMFLHDARLFLSFHSGDYVLVIDPETLKTLARLGFYPLGRSSLIWSLVAAPPSVVKDVSVRGRFVSIVRETVLPIWGSVDTVQLATSVSEGTTSLGESALLHGRYACIKRGGQLTCLDTEDDDAETIVIPARCIRAFVEGHLLFIESQGDGRVLEVFDNQLRRRRTIPLGPSDSVVGVHARYIHVFREETPQEIRFYFLGGI